MSLPSLAEIEHADWPSLQRMCGELGLNPKGRSGIVRMRLLDHARRRARPEAWRAEVGHQAALLTRLGFPEAATGLWESAIRLDAPAPWIGYGAARLSAGELEEALKAFDRAVQMGDVAAHLHRAEVLAARGDLLRAVEACDEYLAAAPNDVRAMVLKMGFLARGGWRDEAAAVLRSAAEIHGHIPEVRRGLGVLSLKAGHPQPAEEAFRAAVHLDDRDVESWMNRGVALLLLGRPREAIGSLREALEQDPTRAEALNDLGAAYLATGQMKPAIVNLGRAAKHLGSPQVVLNLAHAQELAKRRWEALEAYERVLRMRPRNPQALAGRRRVQRKLGRKRPSRRPAAKKPRRIARSGARRRGKGSQRKRP